MAVMDLSGDQNKKTVTTVERQYPYYAHRIRSSLPMQTGFLELNLCAFWQFIGDECQVRISTNVKKVFEWVNLWPQWWAALENLNHCSWRATQGTENATQINARKYLLKGQKSVPATHCRVLKEPIDSAKTCGHNANFKQGPKWKEKVCIQIEYGSHTTSLPLSVMGTKMKKGPWARQQGHPLSTWQTSAV